MVLLLVSVGAGAVSLPDTIDRIRPSIVAIGTYLPTRRPPANFVGTGFVVGNGRQIVTNFHVIPKVIDYTKKERLVIFHGRGKRGKVRTARVVKSDPEHDLALLEIDGKPLPALRLGNADKVREGEEIAFTGFPIGMVLGLYPVTHRGIVSVITPMVIPAMSSKQLTARQIKRLRKPFDVLQLDATAYPGNSGSPVYEQSTGRVIGVVNSVFVKEGKESALSRPTGITYAIPVKYVKRLLQERQ